MIQNAKEKFFQYLSMAIGGDAAVGVVKWLETTDFFNAPASIRNHDAEPGGLVSHSVEVCEAAIELCNSPVFPVMSKESAIKCALLHDVCKANFYKSTTRNVKNEVTGAWEKKPWYEVEDKFPYGHGEKSVFLAQDHVPLTHEEAFAIRWHMGAFDSSAKDYSGSAALSAAFAKYPLALLVHMADMIAVYKQEWNKEALA